jgi:hypothetical protein
VDADNEGVGLDRGLLPSITRVLSPIMRVLPPNTVMLLRQTPCWPMSKEVVADNEVWTPTKRVLASTEGCCRR